MDRLIHTSRRQARQVRLEPCRGPPLIGALGAEPGRFGVSVAEPLGHLGQSGFALDFQRRVPLTRR